MMKKTRLEKILERILDMFKAQREHKNKQRTDPVKALGGFLAGSLIGWMQYRGPKPEKAKGYAGIAKQEHKGRSVVQTPPEAVRARFVEKPHKQPRPASQKKRFSFSPGTLFSLLRETFAQWNEDKAPQLAAALAYYTIFSIAPLMIIVLAVAGLVFDRAAAQEQIIGQISGMVGAEGGDFINSLLENASKPSSGGAIATVLGTIALVLGAIGVMTQLKSALNTIWNVEPAKGPGGIKGIFWMIKEYFLSFTLVLGIGFLLLVSLVVSTGIAAASDYVQTQLGQYVPEFLLHLLNFAVSFGIITLLFAAIYKVLPDVKIAWRDVILGAAITSFLFTVGKFLLGLYLARSSPASTYGAAGSLVIVLLWIYYSAQILFFGAEFTQVYANQYGSNIVAEEPTSPNRPDSPQPTKDEPHKPTGTGSRRAA